MAFTSYTTVQTPIGNVVALATKLLSATGDTDAFLLCGDLMLHVSGVATVFTYTIQRAPFSPSNYDKANGRPADASALVWSNAAAEVTGNPSTGMDVARYVEAGVGWWRVHLTAITGASATVSLSGKTL